MKLLNFKCPRAHVNLKVSFGALTKCHKKFMTQDSCTFEKFISIFLKRDYEAIKNLISSRTFDINSEDFRGVTALHYAAELDDVELIKLILDQPKARINVKTLDMGSTPLMIAAGNDKVEALKYLLERGADAAKTNNYGFTALMIAAEAGSVECVKALLEIVDCDVNAQNHVGVNALMIGIKYSEIVELLINVTDLSQEDGNGENLLHYACAFGSIEIVRMLLDKNSFDINKQNNRGETVVHHAIFGKKFDITDYLIEKGADLGIIGEEELSGYHYIVIRDDSETFIDKLNVPDEILSSILGYAATYNRTKTLKSFLKKFLELNNYDVEISGTFIGALLGSASYHGNLDCIKHLLSLNMVSESGILMSLSESLQRNNYNCFKYIYEYCSEKYKFDMGLFLPAAIQSGCYEACKMILEQPGIDPNGPDPETYLMVASANGHVELVKLLIGHGADINRTHENLGSALLLAVINGRLDLVKYLLEQGADLTLADTNGYTPLICSALYGNYEIFNELYSKDKNIHQKAKDGITVFLAACTSKNVDLVKKLIKLGANVPEVDISNYNCLHLASGSIESLPVLIHLLESLENLDEMLNAKNNEDKTPLDLIIEHKDQKYLFSILAAKVDLNKYLTCPKIFEIENNENEDMCLICRDEFLIGDHATQLPCRHLFHENCINEWSTTKANCPYCQRFPFRLKN